MYIGKRDTTGLTDMESAAKQYQSVGFYIQTIGSNTWETKSVIKDMTDGHFISFCEYQGSLEGARNRLIKLVTNSIIDGDKDFTVTQP